MLTLWPQLTARAPALDFPGSDSRARDGSSNTD